MLHQAGTCFDNPLTWLVCQQRVHATALLPHLVPHQQPLLHTPELRFPLLQLLIGSSQRSTHSKMAVHQVKHILVAAGNTATDLPLDTATDSKGDVTLECRCDLKLGGPKIGTKCLKQRRLTHSAGRCQLCLSEHDQQLKGKAAPTPCLILHA
jgi:hypothetical protein